MKTLEVVRYKQRLDQLFSQIGSLPLDPELRSHWARYLCVMVSGFLEVSVRAIYRNYSRGKSAPTVSNPVESRLESFQSPKMNAIISLARDFSPVWAEELDGLTQGEHKEAVDSIVANRHLIAHGADTGLTFHRIEAWYRSAVEVVEVVEAQCES